MPARRRVVLLLGAIGLFVARDAAAQEAPAEEPPLAPRPPEATAKPIEPPDDPSRTQTVVPQPAKLAPPSIPPFAVDPVADGALILGTGVFSYVLGAINSTGEIRPQQISSDFSSSQLLWIDRVALDGQQNKFGGTISNVGLGAAVAYALVDTVYTGAREHSVQAGLTDIFLYAETFTMTQAITNLAKIAVRRPRPRAYIEREAHLNDPNYSNAETDSALSFFSGHTSFVGAIASTATYLAFVRAPGTLRPWLTLALGAAVTGVVAWGRVADQAHFPTDVIAGAVAGAGIGVLVPHLHRTTSSEQRRVWIGAAPAPVGRDGRPARGGSLTIGGAF